MAEGRSHLCCVAWKGLPCSRLGFACVAMSMMEETDTSLATYGKVEKLTADNYYTWKFNMKMLLMGRDLWEIVEGTEILPQEAGQATRQKFRKRENQALSMICLAVSTPLQIYVRPAKSPREAWKSLSDHFEEKTLSKKISFRRKLYSVRMDSSTNMVDHVNFVRTIAEHLECLDDPVVEKDLVMILLSSLPEDYNNLLTTLETLEEQKLTWEYVRDRLISEFERRKVNTIEKKKGIEDALFVGGNSNTQRQSYKCKAKCHYCHEVGHIQRDCEKKKREKEKEASDEKNENASFCSASTKFVDFCPEFALCVGDALAGCDEDSERWLLDSACSQHMSDDVNDLVNYREFSEGESHNVTLADESVVPAAGQGDLNMHLTDIHGKKIPVVFKNVMFVPTLKKKLISIGQLTQRGAEVVFRRNSVGLSIGSTKFTFGCRVGKMFKLKSAASCCFTSVNVSKISPGNSPSVGVPDFKRDQIHSFPGVISEGKPEIVC